MADKKVTTVKKQPGTLQEQLLSKQLDLIEAKKSLAAGELQNPRAIKNLKKDIARLLTKLNSNKGKGAAEAADSAEPKPTSGKKEEK
ncbi:50S ribosomal protein L29 [Candidatus Saccharibacteria bacterium]|nr:50S ribosomal protein L29 [Candidatus Saccharibacteria bacterium]